MRVVHFLKYGAGCGMAALLANTPAVYAGSADIQFAGFASFAYAKTLDNDDGDVGKILDSSGNALDDKGNIATPRGNITDEGEYRNFNTLGLRMDADMHDNLSFAAQMVAYGSEDYDPEFDWIYARYKFNPELSIDVGKTRVPLYMYSDYIDVAYAYQWIAPPTSIYGRSFFNTIDGGKLNYVTTFGDWSSYVQLFAGKTEESFAVDGYDLSITADRAQGIAWSLDREWLGLRLEYAELDLSLDGFAGVDKLMAGLGAIESGINMMAPAFSLPQLNLASLDQKLQLEDDTNKHMGVGVSLRFDHFFAAGEYTVSDFEPNLATGKKDAYYLLVGTRLPANWSVSLTYGNETQEMDEEIIDEVNKLTRPYIGTGLPGVAMLEGLAGTLRTIVDGAVTAAQEQETTQYILGARWDFHPSASLKMEYILQQYEGYVFNESTLSISDIEREPSAYRIGLDLVF